MNPVNLAFPESEFQARWAKLAKRVSADSLVRTVDLELCARKGHVVQLVNRVNQVYRVR